MKALLKKLTTGRPCLRRTTIVRVRYELGLGLLDLKKTKHFGERATTEYLGMLKHVDRAMQMLKEDHKIIEDYHSPSDLKRA